MEVEEEREGGRYAKYINWHVTERETQMADEIIFYTQKTQETRKSIILLLERFGETGTLMNCRLKCKLAILENKIVGERRELEATWRSKNVGHR